MHHGQIDSPDKRTIVWTAIAVATVVLCFVLATPRSGGPDEPSHMVASAALVRGERAGAPIAGEPALRQFQVPAMVGEPNPGCWAQQPYVPVECAALDSSSTEVVSATTTSANYPPWSYVLPGLASFLPFASAYAYLARLLMAAIPVLLITASLIRIRSLGTGSAIALLLGLTPIAWFSMSIVNPSAVAIAGGLALWAALMTVRNGAGELLLIAAWASTLLARRDGPVWATLIVIAVCAAMSIRPLSLWASLSSWAKWTSLFLVPIPFLTVLLTGQRDLNLLLALAPLALIAVDLAARLYERFDDPIQRVAILGTSFVAAVTFVGAALTLAPGGLENEVLRLIMSNTGEHLRQLVGVLGWIDTPVPTFAVYLFWASLGALAAIAILEQPRIAIIGASALGATVMTAWVLELGQGDDLGRYWQGRYSMPFAVGIPLLLSMRTLRTGSEPVQSSRSIGILARPLGGVVWVILNIGFAAALQRWGVGLAGTWAPWSWDTWGSPIPPWVLLIIHATATGWLIFMFATRSSQQELVETNLTLKRTP